MASKTSTPIARKAGKPIKSTAATATRNAAAPVAKKATTTAAKKAASPMAKGKMASPVAANKKAAVPAQGKAIVPAKKAVRTIARQAPALAPKSTSAPVPAPKKADSATPVPKLVAVSAPAARPPVQAGPVALPKAAPKSGKSTLHVAEVALKHTPDQALPVYQIYFEPAQRHQLDPSFIPLNNANHSDPLREFAVFERLAVEEGTRLAALWGALSWRFAEKTGLSGEALRQQIADHPGNDIYYCNPFPENEALYINSWQQGLTAHPAFGELCALVLKAADLPAAELEGIRSSQSFSACNYFVGSPEFWAAYLPWVRGVIDRARKKLPPNVLAVLDSSQSDPRNMHAGSTYWPFIVERLLPLFLDTEGKHLKKHKLALALPESKLNAHLQRLREMKDVAQRTRSRWLYACWLNYRNLYFLQTAGSEWCRKYLPQINTTELTFI